MALDPSIALSGKPAQLMTPGDAVSLQHMSLQVQQQQLGIQRQQALQKVMSDPGMFDDKGMPSPGLIQKAYSIGDINAAHGLLTARTQGMLSEDKNMRSQTAHTAQLAAIEARKQADLQKSLAGMTKDQRARYDLSQKIGHDVDTYALPAYDVAVKNKDPDAVGKWREARLAKLDELEKSGALAAAGWGPEAIQMARDKINSESDPEVARERTKTTKMREQEQKAQLDSPYKTGQLAVANRRADQGDSRISLQEIGQQLKSDTLDAKIANDERRAGIAEDTIALRDEHSKAVIAVRNARLDMQKDNAQTSAEERERHNRALEDAKARELDLRGKAYGSVKMNAKGEKMQPAPSGYEWNPDEPGSLRPIKGGPKDTGNTYGERASGVQGQKPPTGYRWKDGGPNLEVIPGGPADKGQAGGERAQGTTLLKADKERESAIAGLNRELEAGKITQEQHDAMIAKLTAQGKGGKTGAPEGEIGFSINKDLEKRGWMLDPQVPGQLTYMPGGPQDPKTIEAQAKARRAGTGGKTNVQNTTLSEVGYEGPQLHGDEFLEKQVRPEWHDKIRAIDKNPKLVQTLGRTKEERAMLASLAIQYNPKWGQDSGKGGDGESLTPGGLKVAVELAKQGITLPGGYSKQGISRGNRILNEMARDEAGGSGSGATATGIMEGKAKAGAIKAFASGKQGQNATAINTAIGHLGTVDELASALGNKDTRVLNAIFNRIATETGNAKVNNYEIAVDAVGHELMRVFRQVGASEGETKAWEAKFRASNSPEQLRGAVKTAVELLQSRINALNDEYDRSTGSTGGYPNMLSPKSIKVIERLGGHVSRGAASGPGKTPPPSSGSAPGTAAPGPQKRITATNPKTGEKVELKDGKWVPMQ